MSQVMVDADVREIIKNCFIYSKNATSNYLLPGILISVISENKTILEERFNFSTTSPLHRRLALSVCVDVTAVHEDYFLGWISPWVRRPLRHGGFGRLPRGHGRVPSNHGEQRPRHLSCRWRRETTAKKRRKTSDIFSGKS